MSKGNKGWDNSGDETEFFGRQDSSRNQDWGYGSGSDETEVFGGQGQGYYGQDRQETEFFDRPSQTNNDAPRQQFPEGYDPVSGTYAPGYGPDANRGYQGQGYQGQQYQQPPQNYQQPQYQEPRQPQRPRKKGGSGGLVALGFLAGLALVAAVIFFLMWRGSANEPDPLPVTETATVTQTETVEREPILPTELPDLPSDVIPTELPELPSEVENFDVEGFLNDLLGGGNEPVQPAQ